MSVLPKCRLNVPKARPYIPEIRNCDILSDGPSPFAVAEDFS